MVRGISKVRSLGGIPKRPEEITGTHGTHLQSLEHSWSFYVCGGKNGEEGAGGVSEEKDADPGRSFLLSLP